MEDSNDLAQNLSTKLQTPRNLNKTIFSLKKYVYTFDFYQNFETVFHEHTTYIEKYWKENV